MQKCSKTIEAPEGSTCLPNVSQGICDRNSKLPSVPLPPNPGLTSELLGGLSKYRFPKSDWNSIGIQMIMIIEQVEKELNYNLTPLEQVKILNHIIYDINRFKGDKLAVGNQDYYYMNKLLETHIGNPFSLGMLYCIVAERLDLPVYPVVLPHHFVLAYCKKTRHFPQLEDVLFYINPFDKGVVLTRKDIRNYLNQLNIKPELKFFEPTRNTSVIKSIFKESEDLRI